VGSKDAKLRGVMAIAGTSRTPPRPEEAPQEVPEASAARRRTLSLLAGQLPEVEATAQPMQGVAGEAPTAASTSRSSRVEVAGANVEQVAGAKAEQVADAKAEQVAGVQARPVGSKDAKLRGVMAIAGTSRTPPRPEEAPQEVPEASAARRRTLSLLAGQLPEVEATAQPMQGVAGEAPTSASTSRSGGFDAAPMPPQPSPVIGGGARRSSAKFLFKDRILEAMSRGVDLERGDMEEDIDDWDEDSDEWNDDSDEWNEEKAVAT